MQQRLLAVMATLSVALTLTAAAVHAAKPHHYSIPHYASWLRIAQCETGSRWNWNSGTYQGGLGFYYGTWDAFRPRWFPAEAYWASPNQQMYVAERVWARYGFGAWGAASTPETLNETLAWLRGQPPGVRLYYLFYKARVGIERDLGLQEQLHLPQLTFTHDNARDFFVDSNCRRCRWERRRG